MTEEPTAAEIARVDAWRKENAAELSAQDARAREAKRAGYLEAMRARLVGRTVASIDGSEVDAYAEWRVLRLVFEDGAAVKVDGSWSDGAIDIHFADKAEDS